VLLFPAFHGREISFKLFLTTAHLSRACSKLFDPISAIQLTELTAEMWSVVAVLMHTSSVYL